MTAVAAEEPNGRSGLETRIPARLDRLPWFRFHWIVILALGVTWMLDGLEATLISAVNGVLQSPESLGLDAAQIGFIGSTYVVGAVIGALGFGYLTDVLGRKPMFFATLGVYLVGAALTVVSWDFASLAFARFVLGLGIGGEYAAINSAVDELVPARLRGRVALMVGGGYWISAALAALATFVILDPAIFHPDVGWRVGFGIGAVFGLVILVLRRFVPESPRWLVTHGHNDRAEDLVGGIERDAERRTGRPLPEAGESLTVHPRRRFGFGPIVRAVFVTYRRRSLLGLVLMVTQSFMYNAIFFTYALILTRFYAVPAPNTGAYLLPLALGNAAGALLLAPLFDSLGRRRMISFTYATSAALLALTGWLFAEGALTAATQTVCWTAIFFFASAAAGAAYLTTGEIFPLETRALAIAFFYAAGTGIGGAAAPWVFGVLIESGSRVNLFYGYLVAAALMLTAAVTEALIGIDAERQSLESISKPLSGG